MAILFSITCTTCQARLNVRDASAVGKILACPKCGSMVQIVPPDGWTPPVAAPGQQGARPEHGGGALSSTIAPPQTTAPPEKTASATQPAGQSDFDRTTVETGTTNRQRGAEHQAARSEPSVNIGGNTPVPASRTSAPKKPISKDKANRGDAAASSESTTQRVSENAVGKKKPSPPRGSQGKLPPAEEDLPRNTDARDALSPTAGMPNNDGEAAAPKEDRPGIDPPLRSKPLDGRSEKKEPPRPSSSPGAVGSIVPAGGPAAAHDQNTTGTPSTASSSWPAFSSSSSSWALEVRPRKTPPLQPAAVGGATSSNQQQAAMHREAQPRAAPEGQYAASTANAAESTVSRGGDVDMPVWMSTAEVQWQRRLFLAGGLVSSLILAAAVVGHWVSRQSSEPAAEQAASEPLAMDGNDSAVVNPPGKPDAPAANATDVAASAASQEETHTDITDEPATTDEPAAVDTARVGTADPEEMQSIAPTTQPAVTTEDASPVGAETEKEKEAQRLAIARSEDEAHHRQLVNGLLAYHDVEGAFPPSAGGIVQLAPESRLSWIAMLLPYYERPAWREKLNFRRSWNDPRNQPITRQPLKLVINPLLGPMQTDDGYPVTHYVGMSGVGTDADSLPADHPRAGLFGTRRRVTREMVVDGLSNTIAVMGVAERLGPWSAGGMATTRALTAEPYIHGPDGFGSGRSDGVIAAMADGSVRVLSKDIDPRVLEQMVTIAGESRTRRSLGRGRKGKKARPSEARGIGSQETPGEKVRQAAPHDEKQSVAEKNSNRNSPPTDGEAVPEWLARLDRSIEEIELTAVRLSDVVQLLSDLAAAPIMLDTDALAEVGITPDVKVSLKMHRATVRQMLDEVASQVNAMVEIRPRGIVLSTRTPEKSADSPTMADSAP